MRRSAASPLGPARRVGSHGSTPPRYVELNKRNTCTDADVVHIKQGRQPRCARAGQTKQPQERAPPPSSPGRAAAAAPAPRAAHVHPAAKSDKTKRPQCGPYVIWNCIIYIWIKLQLGKLWPTAVLLDRKLDKVRLGSEKYAARRIQRTSFCLWAIRGSKRRKFCGVSVPPAYPPSVGGSDTAIKKYRAFRARSGTRSAERGGAGGKPVE